jgi:hypothetical protein
MTAIRRYQPPANPKTQIISHNKKKGTCQYNIISLRRRSQIKKFLIYCTVLGLCCIVCPFGARFQLKSILPKSGHLSRWALAAARRYPEFRNRYGGWAHKYLDCVIIIKYIRAIQALA